MAKRTAVTGEKARRVQLDADPSLVTNLEGSERTAQKARDYIKAEKLERFPLDATSA